TACLDVELVEDRLRLGIAAAVCKPLRTQPFVELVEAIVGIEDATHDELRRDRAVPMVLLQAEGDVVPSDTAGTVELGSLAERNRSARVTPVTLQTETQMLSVTDRCQFAELAPRRKQRHVRVAEAERRKPPQLLAQLERQLRAARQHGVDDGQRHEIV